MESKMIEIKIRFKSGEVGYFELEDDVEKTFEYLGNMIVNNYKGVVELIDLADNKRTFVNISDISSFGYSEVTK